MKNISFKYIPQWKLSYSLLSSSTNWVGSYAGYCVRYRGFLHCLPSGTNDDVSFFEDESFIFLYSQNSKLDYCGLSVLFKNSIEEGFQHVVFIQNSWELEEIGINLDKQSTEEIFNILLQWL